jgi:hypothetical protein
MRRSSPFVLLIGAFFVIGCAAQAAQSPATPAGGASTLSPAGSPPVQTGTSTACNPHDFLDKVRAAVPYSEVSLVHNNQIGVNLWVVDPDLDSNATGDAAAATNAQAAQLAARLSFLVVNDDPCMRVSFRVITTEIVDSRYHAWFIGGIEIADIPEGSDLTGDALASLTKGFQTSPLLQTPVESPSSAAPSQGACTWNQVHQRLLSYFVPEGPNIDFYLVIDQDGANVWAQWMGPDPTVSPQKFIFGLNALQTELACLNPPVDILWMTYTDSDGVVSLMGTLDGATLRNTSPSDLPGQIQIIYPPSNP